MYTDMEEEEREIADDVAGAVVAEVVVPDAVVVPVSLAVLAACHYVVKLPVATDWAFMPAVCVSHQFHSPSAKTGYVGNLFPPGGTYLRECIPKCPPRFDKGPRFPPSSF